ncbi:phosphoenolpyruvate--protein phosphotransferase [Phormidium sp. CCY1219]|uniref:phosphoenolpyruvate--protein phosphotransferase n=1 Tax=Phormidium sp. CCY1219 TaxID=2886104 RepID=UPI002D1EF388|nr:phosphoenolpyruvate--protein phosphotransferase [Phormidium sp. CCY1219]MEB3826800.1 phosphoenolpyruvate--protein phosphotransferase [Phormidium sp. CCY1219]
MVGIVIVSHSAKLAAGVRELAAQMAREPVPIAIAAGIDDPENPFGTDPMQVYQAIESLYDDTGVVVLMDLGSAVMSAEMALEFVEPDKRSNVILCEAPLVEGAIAAVVQAAGGATLDRVIAEAREAIAPKASQIKASAPPTASSEPEQTQQGDRPPSNRHEIVLPVLNTLGIHARPAAKLVQIANRFSCEISLRNCSKDTQAINAKSINQVTTLGVRQGDEIEIAARGKDALPALAALQELVENRFGESEKPAPKTQQPAIAAGEVQSDEIRGTPVSPGIAIAPVVRYEPAIPDVTHLQGDNPEDEWQQLHFAIQTARRQIQVLGHKIANREDAGIFAAHKLFLKDPALLEIARECIFQHHYSAAAAWKQAIDKIVADYEALDDPYLKSRASDVKDVGLRVLRLLIDVRGISLELPQPGILVAPELKPSEVAQLNPEKVRAICTAVGGANNHSAILARSLGIPAVMGIGASLARLTEGTAIALDGETGQVWVQPQPDRIAQLQDKLAAKAATAKLPRQTKTADGRRIGIQANIVGVAGAKAALDMGADGVGLLRTEFLYLDRPHPPSEEEQVDLYQAIAATLEEKPLTIRTLDIGGDKPVPYLDLEPEANPFLGLRGIRLLLEFPELLKTQLRAILRVSHRYPVQVMFPTIALLCELRAAKQILAEVQEQLRSHGIRFDEGMGVGITIEVPSAVEIADRLAPEVDFFSIGTNDLSQYAIAADRTHPKVAHLADAFEPAVLRAIARTVQAAHHAKIKVAVCGELAAFPEATPILLGLGVDELSMNPTAIPGVKSVISRLTVDRAEAIAAAVLQLDSAAAVKAYLPEKIRD